jgi:Spy/CpxP family protein refolding chaperone
MSFKLKGRFETGMIVFLVIVGYAVCFIPAVTQAFEHRDRRPAKAVTGNDQYRQAFGIWRNPQTVKNLELSDTQVAQIKEADFAFREKHLAWKAQLDGLRLQMDRGFSEETVDDAAIISLAEKMADIRSKLFVQRIESRLALGKILNADQVKMLRLYEMHPGKKGVRAGRKCIAGRLPGELPD